MLFILAAFVLTISSITSSHYKGPPGTCNCKCDPSGLTYQWGRHRNTYGDCKTKYLGSVWCYVDDSVSSGCTDLVDSEQYPGRKWSHQACKSVHMKCSTPAPPKSPTSAVASPDTSVVVSGRHPRGVSRSCEYKDSKHENPDKQQHSRNSNLGDCKRECEQKGNCLFWSLEESSKKCYHYMESFKYEKGTTTGYPYCGLCP
eukprot:TRINITY_DN31311_c0_g1_i10.p1 TRINITY_DN31311_c0_g1~~TRINITY_DN31311_c0_g1_i10.p1  ORF type:complete len:201 (-),score=3.52 TRINITY_DN31311_c0_g1_i10:268-870(-)